MIYTVTVTHHRGSYLIITDVPCTSHSVNVFRNNKPHWQMNNFRQLSNPINSSYHSLWLKLLIAEKLAIESLQCK